MYPRQWTKIGSLVDRDPDAVHLRYQSYILPRNRGGANGELNHLVYISGETEFLRSQGSMV